MKKIKKPNNYKEHFIVYDPNPILIICVTNSHWQLSKELSKSDIDEFEVKEEGDYLIINQID